MKTISKIEQDVNQIRLKIYEETKDLTPEQYKKRLDSVTESAAKKYGFKIVASAKSPEYMEVRENEDSHPYRG